MAQFDALLEILEPHIKKKTTNFCEQCVRIYIQSYVLRDEVDELTIAILEFSVHLYGGSELSKRLSKCLPRMEPDPNFFMMDEHFGASV